MGLDVARGFLSPRGPYQVKYYFSGGNKGGPPVSETSVSSFRAYVNLNEEEKPWMASSRFALTAEDLVLFHRCLSSKICIRIFKTLLNSRVLNISAISRKVGCTNRDGLRHLKNLVKLGMVEEEFYAGLHNFTLKMGGFTELMEQAVEILEGGE